MAAMAIGTIVLLVAASLLGRVGGDYGRIAGGVGTEREARAALAQITTDASTAWSHRDQQFEVGDGDWPTGRVGFLSLQPAAAQSDEGRLGDLCAVNYYLKDLMVGERPVRCLMRGFRESDDTFAALRDGGVGGLFAENERDEPVAFGLVGFEARPLRRIEGGNWTEWTQSGGDDEDTAPEALRVRMVVVTGEMLGKMRTVADWDGQGLAGSLLGRPDNAAMNKNLEVYESIVRFGRR